VVLAIAWLTFDFEGAMMGAGLDHACQEYEKQVPFSIHRGGLGGQRSSG
jgi:hypothetical protein